MASPRRVVSIEEIHPGSSPSRELQELSSTIYGSTPNSGRNGSGGGIRGACLDDILSGFGLEAAVPGSNCRLRAGIQVGERLGRISALLEASGRKEHELVRELAQEGAAFRAEVRQQQRDLSERLSRELSTSTAWKDEFIAELRQERHAREAFEEEMRRLVDTTGARAQAALDKHAASQKAMIIEERAANARRQEELFANLQREQEAQKASDEEFRTMVEQSQVEIRHLATQALESQAADIQVRLRQEAAGRSEELRAELQVASREERHSAKAQLTDALNNLRRAIDVKLFDARRETFALLNERVADLRHQSDREAVVVRVLSPDRVSPPSSEPAAVVSAPPHALTLHTAPATTMAVVSPCVVPATTVTTAVPQSRQTSRVRSTSRQKSTMSPRSRFQFASAQCVMSPRHRERSLGLPTPRSTSSTSATTFSTGNTFLLSSAEDLRADAMVLTPHTLPENALMQAPPRAASPWHSIPVPRRSLPVSVFAQNP